MTNPVIREKWTGKWRCGEMDPQQGAEGCWGEARLSWHCQVGGNPAGPKATHCI